MSDRVAIVTGGSGGIGRAVAERLAADGMRIVVHYAGNAGHADEVVKNITDHGGSAYAARGDVADAERVSALFDEAEQHFGGIDVVVNTAGVMPLKPLAELDLDEFDLVQRTNLRGAFVVSREAARRLRAGGALINFSSTVVALALPTYSAYAAAKAGVEALTPILAKELRGRDVTVNAVAPGPTATPLFLNGKDEKTVEEFAKRAPLERLGRPDDVAEVVAFLAGPARWINGQTIRANGGVA